MKVILSTGLQTPTGVITERSHDTSRAYYIYESVKAGDGTIEDVRCSTISKQHLQLLNDFTAFLMGAS
jgi:hypothetical protein